VFKPVAGVLVGGRSSRMGGSPKGLLRLPSGETILERTLHIAREAGCDAVLVGNLDAYDAVAAKHGVTRLPDVANVQGPLAGLQALLEHAGARSAIALACDMPFVTGALLQRLASESPEAIVLAPRSADSQKWEPLCARYHSERVRPVLRAAMDAGEQSIQQLFTRVQVTELHLSSEERSVTRDWDTPADIAR
jgi:molybdenum cofactor guanylyltransferase